MCFSLYLFQIEKSPNDILSTGASYFSLFMQVISAYLCDSINKAISDLTVISSIAFLVKSKSTPDQNTGIHFIQCFMQSKCFLEFPDLIKLAVFFDKETPKISKNSSFIFFIIFSLKIHECNEETFESYKKHYE